jgi:hypothetical protein
MLASVPTVEPRTLAWDETQASASPPNSRLPSADAHLCPHTTYVRGLASQTAYSSGTAAPSSGGTPNIRSSLLAAAPGKRIWAACM